MQQRSLRRRSRVPSSDQRAGPGQPGMQKQWPQQQRRLLPTRSPFRRPCCSSEHAVPHPGGHGDASSASAIPGGLKERGFSHAVCEPFVLVIPMGPSVPRNLLLGLPSTNHRPLSFVVKALNHPNLRYLLENTRQIILKKLAAYPNRIC